MPSWSGCMDWAFGKRKEMEFSSTSRERGPVETDLTEIQRLRGIVGVLTEYVNEVSDEQEVPEAVKGLFRIPGDCRTIESLWFDLEETANKSEAEEILMEGFNAAESLSSKGNHANAISSLLKQRLDAGSKVLFPATFAFKKYDENADFLKEVKSMVKDCFENEKAQNETILFLAEYFSLLQSVAESQVFLLESGTLATMVFKSLCLGAKDANLTLVYYGQTKNDVNLKHAIENGHQILDDLLDSEESEEDESEDSVLLVTPQIMSELKDLDVNRAARSLEEFMVRSINSLDSEASLYRFGDVNSKVVSGKFKELDLDMLSFSPKSETKSNSFEGARRNGFYEVPSKDDYRTSSFMKVDSAKNAFVPMNLTTRREFKF